MSHRAADFDCTFPPYGAYVRVSLSNGTEDYAVWVNGFMLCEKATARSHGHYVGTATEPFWLEWKELAT